MKDLSVIIPSRSELYLQKTIDDILSKARGNIEVIVSLDGYWPKEYNWSDPRLIIIHQGTATKSKGMRACINAGMAVAKGRYVMKTDEHCMFDTGFDLKLIADCKNNWVVIPRRFRLDADKWEIIEDGRPPIDYMKLKIDDNGYMHGVEWRKRAEERAEPEFDIDNTPSFQGSCWFMSKKYWEELGPMDDVNYGPFSQEAQEIGNKAWLSGGRVVVNKKTWYAHWHKDTPGYNFTPEQQKAFKAGVEKGRLYCNDFWLNNRWDKRKYDFEWLVNKFKDGAE